jgi:DNA-binding protein HU-beta
MNREQLIRDVARESRVSRKEAEEALEAIVDGIVYALRRGEQVPLPGVGILSMRRAPNARGRSQPRRVVVLTRSKKTSRASG